MTTCLCGIFDPETGRLRFSNAGHPPPLVRRADGSVERLTGALSHPLGAGASMQHVQADVELAVGDALLLYTDGLVERRGEIIDEGIDRLAQRLGASPLDPEGVCEGIESALEPGLGDDVAILALVRAPMANAEMRAVVPAHPDELADLRRRVGAWLAAQGAGRTERDDVVLAVHEAAMNAVEHAYGPADAELTVTAAMRDGAVVITVADEGRWREPRDPRRGRGRGIMTAVMDHVTIDTGPRGSSVTLISRLEGAE
jgi:anti-sigma regulatory factor (Ser/Thr protein kinase)